MKKVLTIAGSDCSGGAGVQADLKTMSAHGVFAMSVIVSVVAENTSRVIDIENISTKNILAQIDAIYEDIGTDAVKIGMLSNEECMKAVAKGIKKYKPKNIVVDPVMYAKNGCPLMDENSIDALIKNILPIADLLTPNIPEAEKIAGIEIKNRDDMKKAAKIINEKGCKNVLIKGGHSLDDVTDVLYSNGIFYNFEGKRINTKNTHGTGCTLSSAIASNLSLGYSMEESIKRAKKYINMAIENSLEIGKGHGPTNHFHALYEGGLKAMRNLEE
ncbi:bifunctional hydroxymethylpyrimidine kinase/phosphomethylpyrimidine kinase [Peptoniphilus stercorisuis]|uniref:Hydroxymethylpyrimidine/phosphomethylpyrimidine kinase n=1 Tax=Peptoniphilus stercorisuis TaxID=1436965 RepID=A0ABS4KEH5_9FIRM|nr:bifunctional hydroxymethylpyrimidine kinase/phosphomethylpyrimidine kinase [Peptoniphilus stercorisuis]MBP2025039.1 hydroxymethylpyrimidine/phosphomethylpyrimidine kinase [Peptoniphilus stercorisuis]